MLRINNCGITGDLTISIQTSRNNERTKRLKFVRPSAIFQATQLPLRMPVYGLFSFPKKSGYKLTSKMAEKMAGTNAAFALK